MYLFGIDIPLVELILGLSIVSIIILVELILVLVLISFHMRNSKRLEGQIEKLTKALMRLQVKEIKELNKLSVLGEKEEDLISKIKIQNKPKKKSKKNTKKAIRNKDR